ncbi:uncharacterized protein K02A2.6-like [Haliotis rubra]|uniref:uncharacterized protein K02A2.6-like n=1 Tax=Haliotis rubra TaxID=36100 RepID=UPI001EE618D2|nr:uncharacterized protein K02A2.6-like [Haliotis rubra]
MSQCKEPMIPTEVPKLPWQIVATDLFQLDGRDYLIVVDFYSRFNEIALLVNTKSSTVITHLKSIFARHGIPSRIISDNGPQYSSTDFRSFADSWNIEHVTSSPLYPRANGLAEKSVQTVKRLLTKAKQSGSDPYLSLLAYRNTPIGDTGCSPSQLLMGRRLRDNLPCKTILLIPETQEGNKVYTALSDSKDNQKFYYDRSAHSRADFQSDDTNRMRQGRHWIPATVTGRAETPRSYYVKTAEGAEYRRNKRDIIPDEQNSRREAPSPPASTSTSPAASAKIEISYHNIDSNRNS